MLDEEPITSSLQFVKKQVAKELARIEADKRKRELSAKRAKATKAQKKRMQYEQLKKEFETLEVSDAVE